MIYRLAEKIRARQRLELIAAFKWIKNGGDNRKTVEAKRRTRYHRCNACAVRGGPLLSRGTFIHAGEDPLKFMVVVKATECRPRRGGLFVGETTAGDLPFSFITFRFIVFLRHSFLIATSDSAWYLFVNVHRG